MMHFMQKDLVLMINGVQPIRMFQHRIRTKPRVNTFIIFDSMNGLIE